MNSTLNEQANNISIDQEVLLYIVRNLVNHPEDVLIQRQVDEMGVLLILTVHPEDMGKIIGRGGGMARSLRTYIKALGKKYRMLVSLNIMEPAESNRPGRVYKDQDRLNNEQQNQASDSGDSSKSSSDDDLAEFAIT